MIKVRILDRCEFCDGEACPPDGLTTRSFADFRKLPNSPKKGVDYRKELVLIQLGSVLERLRQMLGFNSAFPCEVGDCSRQFQYAMVGASR